MYDLKLSKRLEERAMTNIFDDGLSAEELAMALGLAEEIAEEERYRRQWLQEEEPILPEDDDSDDDDALGWYERE
jgi:hypothetical protein